MEKILIARNSKHLQQAEQLEVIKSGYIKEISDEMVKKRILEGNYSTDLDADFN